MSTSNLIVPKAIYYQLYHGDEGGAVDVGLGSSNNENSSGGRCSEVRCSNGRGKYSAVRWRSRGIGDEVLMVDA